MFQPIRVERVAEKVANQLKEAISSGSLRAGERLPSERELAEQMGVSRPSIREAIQILSAQGILDNVHGGGSIVRNLTDQEIRRPIEIFLEDDTQRVLELTEVRSLLEAWAARKAAQNRTERDVARIKRYLDEMEQDFANGELRLEVDFKFHTEVAAATRNTVFLHLIDTIYQLTNFSIKVHSKEKDFLTRQDQSTILEHHRRIYESIATRNPDKAEAAMREHLSFLIDEFSQAATSLKRSDQP